MNAVSLPPINSGELGRRSDADFGKPSLRAIIVSEPAVSAVASILFTRQLKLGAIVTHIEHSPEARALVQLRRARKGLAVVSGIDGFSEEEWQRLDLLRSPLAREGSTWFVLSLRSFTLLSRNAPNLASLLNISTLLDRELSPHDTDEEAAQAEFDRLSRTWLDATMVTSSLTKKIQNPAYQAIIAMGKRMIPPILRDLQREPKLWGPALHSITGVNPVRKGDEGKVRRVAAAWLTWAKANGYEW